MSYIEHYNKLSLKLQELLLLIFAFIFIFGYRYAHLAVILITLNWLVRFLTNRNNNPRPRYLPLLFLVHCSFFFIVAIGLINTSDLSTGLKKIERVLPILIFPIIFLTSTPLSSKSIKKVFFSYIIACFIALLICLGHAIWQEIAIKGYSTFTYEQFTGHPLASALNLHPTYLALYIIVGIVLSFYLIDYKYFKSRDSIFLLLFIPLASVFVLLLNARTEIIILILFFIVRIVHYIIKSENRKLRLITALSLGIPLLLIFFYTPLAENLTKRFSEIRNTANSNLIGTNQENGVNQRAFLWEQGSLLIRENPIFGIGTGDYDNVFKEHLNKYIAANPTLSESKINAIKSLISNELNLHNQYLQVLLQYGITGFICFILAFTISGYWSYQNGNYLHLIFLFLIGIAMVSENILDRASGVYLFSFFNSLLGIAIFSEKTVSILDIEKKI